MTVNQFIKNICKSLGNNNKSIYPVVAIATANGIFRPAFTMLKKGENPESKKYAALRECLTEIIAVPTYWFSGVLLGKCGKKIVDKAMDVKFANMEKNGKLLSENVKLHMKNSAIKKGQSGLMLIGVCFAAGTVLNAIVGSLERCTVFCGTGVLKSSGLICLLACCTDCIGCGVRLYFEYISCFVCTDEAAC